MYGHVFIYKYKKIINNNDMLYSAIMTHFIIKISYIMLGYSTLTYT